VLTAVEEVLAGGGPRTRDLGGTATTAELIAALTSSLEATSTEG
jgi:isocitrate/isopropylmalate dehydrogenase